MEDLIVVKTFLYRHEAEVAKGLLNEKGIDSQNELTWHVVKPLFTYFANKFSRDLGEKIRKGIKRKKECGRYNGGRPIKNG